ncbi:serine protease inhibitor-like [Galendromus occidentalis]|uniref:Serine protease inhibitor-like n=1 Tax=Galendromus occidentalis TaxID=34638 RepID=A0AAJ7L3U0_9ACAR|nr:serine protease inhibitor-like [Galendromus occidentalis]
MVTIGLDGEARTEILECLKAPDEKALHSVLPTLIGSRRSPLKIANLILADSKCDFRQDTGKLLKSRFRADVGSVDFSKDAKAIEKCVNMRVAKKTNKKIEEVLAENSLGQDNILVFLNAIYFKGIWLRKFDTDGQRNYFELRSGERVEVDFMSLKSRTFSYRETSKLRLIRIPYKEKGFSMIAAIPKDERKHIDEVIADISMFELASTIESVGKPSGITVLLTMPQFRIEYNFDSIPEYLKDLGVKKMFVPGECNLGNLFSKVESQPCVSDIIHKAVIEVSETRSEASLFNFGFKCPRARSRPVLVLRLSKPFCFWILSGKDMVTFAGICADPRS